MYRFSLLIPRPFENSKASQIFALQIFFFKTTNLIVLLTLWMTLLGLTKPAYTAEPIRKSKVIVSFSILEDLTQQIGKDKIEIVSIIDRMGDPHDFEPRSKQLILLKDADLFIYNGLGFEPWVELFLKQSEYKKKSLDLSETLKLEPADLNPHVWQNPKYLILYIRQIQEALTILQPKAKDFFAQNAQTLTTEIQSIHETFQIQFKRNLQKLNFTPPTLITPHNGFYHLSKAYGISYLPLAANEHHENLSAKALKQMIDQIKKINPVLLYDEWGLNSALLNTVARDLHIKKCGSLLSDSLTLKSGPGFTIQDFLKFNHQQLLTTCSLK